MYLARSGSPGSRTASAYSPGSARTWIGMARGLYRDARIGSMPSVAEPTLDQVLEFCARDPVERVFLEDVARRGFGRFVSVPAGDGMLAALCHLGANLVPSGEGCEAFADVAASSASKMIIGNERAVDELWTAVGHRMARPRAARPGQPVYAISEPPEPGGAGLRAATFDDLELLVPICAAAHEFELGV